HLSYSIDPRGRRVGRVLNGQATHRWLYSTGPRPVAELDASGQVTTRFVYGDSPWVPAYLVKGCPTYPIVADNTNSVRLVVARASGAIAQRIDYGEFGQVTLDTNPGFQPFGFAGGLYDSLTGLVRLGARDYDASAGRFTARDPLLFSAGDTNL